MRSPKETKQISVRIDQEVYDDLLRFCEEKGMVQRQAIQRALSYWIHPLADPQYKRKEGVGA
jgi:Replication regulatory protein RepB